jgi:Family of unknown function (DUF6011)
MTAAPIAPIWTGAVDAWTLRTMREAQEFRRANPDPEHAAADAFLDALLASAEEIAATKGTRTEIERVEEPHSRPQGGAGVGASANRNAATPAQLGYIAKLAAALGYELQEPRDKSHASLIIDGAKKALAAKPAAARPARMATERQQDFLANLLVERDHTYGEIDPATVTFDAARTMLDALMAAPRAKVAAHGIAEGRYAHSVDGGQTADHYRVTRTGRIKVWTAGGEWPYNGALNAALQWIRDNQREAASLFGRLTETCGRCGRPLSDDDSRARGLGPVCAGKGW